ncbi:MAG: LptF/LptG family permease [Rhodobacteraceae bacterium]|nr:LptF/LptG family permease [Paracoccaceae bacterium]
MTQLDLYLIKRMIIQFLFFTLVLTAVFWINTVGKLIEIVLPSIDELLPLMTYFSLFLPKAATTIMPVSAFAAVTYITFRLIVNGEMAAIQATAGFSILRFLRPYLVFSLLLFLLASAFTHILTPASRTATETLDRHVIEVFNLSNIRTGEFLFPIDGVAIFIESVSIENPDDTDGDEETRTFENVFIHDRRSGQYTYTIFAEKAYLLEIGTEYLVVLLDGHTERLSVDPQEISVLNFDKSILRVTLGASGNAMRDSSLDQITSRRLLDPEAFDPPLTGDEIERAFFVLNERIGDSLIIALVALFGGAIVYSFGMLAMSRNFSILVAIIIVIISYVVGENAVSYVEFQDGYWLFAYASAAILLFATIGSLIVPRRTLRYFAFMEAR